MNKNIKQRNIYRAYGWVFIIENVREDLSIEIYIEIHLAIFI